MKKVVYFILILGVALGIYWKYGDYIREKLVTITEKRLEVEEVTAEINELYIYGRSFNLSGTIKIEDMNFNHLKLLLYNNEYKYYDLNYELKDTTVYFWISDELNDGIILDEINIGRYYLFLEIGYSDSDEGSKKYYPLKNTTEYKETTYYTLSSANKKVRISSEESYPTMLLNVVENKEDDIYDIVLDPGHGGMDSGAVKGKYKESALTYELASLLKEKLENLGFSVALTHDGDIPSNEVMDYYDQFGRAVIPQNLKAKYLLSLHFNSASASYVKGLEIYTADKIDYTLARSLANQLIQKVNHEFSNNDSFKVYDGVYTRNFTEREIKETNQEAKRKGRTPYSITTKSNYFYMIRETGGFMTGAYVDNRNADTVGTNPYYHSNVGVEAYILELGYITNDKDLNNFLNHKEKYASVIADTLYDNLKNTNQT